MLRDRKIATGIDTVRLRKLVTLTEIKEGRMEENNC